ncbi:hypothetical protein EVAR_38523_1 [Eumeta japonica]|uniref:Uncharacterized protein n=1 Tax=Eumeta variegata TaxID=151549 RepID=A0A4C1WCC2_EUMVA|nr:hypothetical protein EVAR_38523_1 [Eumeta japonica]
MRDPIRARRGFSAPPAREISILFIPDWVHLQGLSAVNLGCTPTLTILEVISGRRSDFRLLRLGVTYENVTLGTCDESPNERKARRMPRLSHSTMIEKLTGTRKALAVGQTTPPAPATEIRLRDFNRPGRAGAGAAPVL